MRNKYFNTFIHKVINKETKKTKVYISNFPQDIIFELVEYIQNYWKGGYHDYIYIYQEIIIKNRIFDNFNLSYCFFKNRVCIENCIFSQTVSFEESILEKKIFPPAIEPSLFKNIKIKSPRINFKSAKFNNLKFENIEFFQIPHIQGQCTDFKSSSLFDVTFEEVKFHIPSIFEFSQLEDVSFKNCTFKGNTDFRDVSFKGKSEFLNCTFEPLTNAPNEQVLFSDSTFEGKTDFTGSSFNVKTNFSEVIFEGDTNFSESIFGKEGDTSSYEVYFNDAKFKKNIRFHFCQFYNEVNFYNTSFEKLTDFYLVNFYKAQQFHLTDFLDRAIFSNTIFYREAQFLYNKVENNSYINFESAIFKRGLDISRSNFNCNLNFWNTTIEEEGEDYIFKNIDDIKYKNDFDAHNKVPSVYKQLRETYRIIKDNSYKQNNKIEALEFSKREMLVYEKELKSLSTDKILLLANKFSNNYGTNWVKGLLFTMLSGFITYSTILYIEKKVNSTYSILLICFLFVVIISKTENIKEILQKVSFVFFCCLYVTILCFCNTPFAINWELFIEHYLKVLNVIDLKPFEKEENSIFNLSGLSYLFLFIGRIFIGYGYYQTIQAFRKFGKS